MAGSTDELALGQQRVANSGCSRMDLFGNRESLLTRDRPGFDPLGDRRTFHQFHHQRVLGAGIFQAVDGSNVRVIQRRQNFGFAAEMAQPVGVACNSGRQDLQRNFAAELTVTER